LNTAIGYGEASDLFTVFPAPFAGDSVDDTAVLLRYTLIGDADLNRSVDIGDFSLLGSNFNALATRWTRGNFNYDGGTDIGDFSLLAANFNQTLSRRAPTAPPLFSGAPVGDEHDDTEGAWARIA
jgi:hypothetical protein